MNRITCKTFRATITIGLFKGYTQEVISWNILKNEITSIQNKIKTKFDIVLSAKLYACEIICLGQEEPSVSFEFIQYPKFITEEKLLKNAIIEFTEEIQNALEQNRVVIVFEDETIMIEKTSAIDPKIKM